jgi:hypothetical protein
MHSDRSKYVYVCTVRRAPCGCGVRSRVRARERAKSVSSAGWSSGMKSKTARAGVPDQSPDGPCPAEKMMAGRMLRAESQRGAYPPQFLAVERNRDSRCSLNASSFFRFASSKPLPWTVIDSSGQRPFQPSCARLYFMRCDSFGSWEALMPPAFLQQ